MEDEKKICEIHKYEKNSVLYLIGWDGNNVYYSRADKVIWFNIIPSPVPNPTKIEYAIEEGIRFIENNDNI